MDDDDDDDDEEEEEEEEEEERTLINPSISNCRQKGLAKNKLHD